MSKLSVRILQLWWQNKENNPYTLCNRQQKLNFVNSFFVIRGGFSKGNLRWGEAIHHFDTQKYVTALRPSYFGLEISRLSHFTCFLFHFPSVLSIRDGLVITFLHTYQWGLVLLVPQGKKRWHLLDTSALCWFTLHSVY